MFGKRTQRHGRPAPRPRSSPSRRRRPVPVEPKAVGDEQRRRPRADEQCRCSERVATRKNTTT